MLVLKEVTEASQSVSLPVDGSLQHDLVPGTAETARTPPTKPARIRADETNRCPSCRATPTVADCAHRADRHRTGCRARSEGAASVNRVSERPGAYAKTISGGVAHDLPDDLRKALRSDRTALAIWEDLTPLARNEWICWVMSVKKPETRREHVERVCSELHDGMRRPCCFIGCIHRSDKPLSASQKFILGRRSKT